MKPDRVAKVENCGEKKGPKVPTSKRINRTAIKRTIA